MDGRTGYKDKFGGKGRVRGKGRDGWMDSGGMSADNG